MDPTLRSTLTPRLTLRDIMRRTPVPLRLAPLAVACALAACSDAVTAPSGASGTSGGPQLTMTSIAMRQDRLATIEFRGRFPVLYIQNANGSGRFQVHFDGVRDRIAGNYTADELPVRDDQIWGLGPAKWSPDGQQLAVVVTLATDQSQVVVMDADGRNMRTASPNGQVIMGDVDWAPDGKAIVYTMGTNFFGSRPDLFVTDLRRDEVRRLTVGGRFSVWDEYRFDRTGARVFFTQFAGFTEDGLNRVSRVHSVDLAGNVTETANTIVGDPQGLARDGSWALVIRRAAGADPNGWVKEFARVPVAGGAGTVLGQGVLLYAELLEGDREAVLVDVNGADPWSGSRRYQLTGLAGGGAGGLLGVSPSASSMALLRAPR